jgi:hypothetical protein
MTYIHAAECSGGLIYDYILEIIENSLPHVIFPAELFTAACHFPGRIHLLFRLLSGPQSPAELHSSAECGKIEVRFLPSSIFLGRGDHRAFTSTGHFHYFDPCFLRMCFEV